MADQTIKIEREDPATVAFQMAKVLWWEEHQRNPKASDADFMKLVAICAMALRGVDPDRPRDWIRSIYNR